MCGAGAPAYAGPVPRWIHPSPRLRGHLQDAVLALLLVAIDLPRGTEATANAPASLVRLALMWWWSFTAVMVAGLLLRRRWPVLALGVTTLAAAGHALVRGPEVSFPMLIELAVPVTLYTVAERGRSRRGSLAALTLLIAATLALGALAPVSLLNGRDPAAAQASPGRDGAPPAKRSPAVTLAAAVRLKIVEPTLTTLLALALAYALGEAARSRQAHLRTLHQRAADAEREQQQRIALATATERARIGRDLHDVVTHSLSVMVAQAQAALAAQHRHPERSTQAMRAVLTVGRESLAGMRRLVGAFGPAEDPDRATDPPVGIAALPALVDRVRTAGIPVRLAVTGAADEVPAGVDVSAYRIVQEALTNVLRHAGAGARAEVRVTLGPEGVELEVTDDGAGPATGPAAAPGNGLRGMAERAHLLGGTLSAAPLPGGGFAVRALLPLAARTRAAAERLGTRW
jgi:signal transduction histidine kinase